MAKYVKIEAIKKSIAECFGDLTEKDAEYIVERVPDADVVEVKHGYWIERDYKTFDGFETERHINEGLKCSECNCVFRKKLLWRDNYCPECGAKMDGERKCDNG